MKNSRNFFLLLSLLTLSACSLLVDTQTQPVIATSTSAQGSQSPIATIQADLPSETPEPSNDEIVFPTPTSLVPTPIAVERYRLVNWTPQLANQLIVTLREYPDILGFPERGYHDSGYYAASGYALFAEQEALLRFPASSFKEAWIWDAGYRMAQIGEPKVIEAYAQLIGQTLNTGTTDIARLEGWFNAHEDRLQLKVSVLAQLAAQQDNYLVEISDLYHTSGIYLWLIKDQSFFSIYPLPASDHGSYGDFGFASAEGIESEWQDVTGDGIAEIITTHAFFPGSGDALTTNFDIFDISRTPPHKIQFVPPIPARRHRTWSFVHENGQSPRMRFEFVFDRILCPFKIGKEYQWNGTVFELINQTYPEKSQIIEQAGAECLDPLVFSLLLDLEHGDINVLDELDDLIADWPYSNSGWWPNHDNAPDARDKARFIMGLYLALNGHTDDSRREMSLIISNPVVSTSRWLTPAKEFLAHFNTPEDLLMACVAVKICADFLDIDQLAAIAKTSNAQNSVDFLRQVGVDIIASGSIDANNDGQMDYWVTIANGSDNPTVWLFVTTDNGPMAFSLGNSSKNGPISFHPQPPFQDFPVFSMEAEEGIETFIFESDPISSEIQLSRLCDHIRLKLDKVEENLLGGQHPTKIIEDLSRMGPRLDVACSYPYNQAKYITPRWQYLLGLAYELVGDSTHAAENYFALWQSYPGSPFAIMSHSKLEITP
ncbi:MAG TPA: hypothetical protein VJM08_10190 [Anaerolineales bacterium]|nr:hypothetical protein [Anaerolineales bacterium]